LAAAERALELNPESAEALAAKSRILAGLDNWDDALALTERSLQRDPQSYDVCFYAGSNYFLAGR
jgi:tetratricopeptide (TPR) repeat protein